MRLDIKSAWPVRAQSLKPASYPLSRKVIKDEKQNTHTHTHTHIHTHTHTHTHTQTHNLKSHDLKTYWKYSLVKSSNPLPQNKKLLSSQVDNLQFPSLLPSIFFHPFTPSPFTPIWSTIRHLRNNMHSEKYYCKVRDKKV